MKRTCVVLYGGKSGEHEVSLMSGATVFRNIDRERFEPVLVGIDRDGRWFLQPDEVYRAALSGEEPLEIVRNPDALVYCAPAVGLTCGTRALACDVVFPVLHGSLGEDGTVQGLLEVAEIPYVGAGVLGSAVGMDKELVKHLWRAAGIPTLDSLSAQRAGLSTEQGREAFIDRCVDRFGSELFIKPARTGSSVGITKTHNRSEIDPAITTALTFDTKILVEPAYSVREIEISVLGNDSPRAFPPGEVVPSHEFYDYDAKYIDPNGAQLVVPAELSDELIAQACSIAEGAYAAAACEGMARVDLFLLKDSGELVVNEINTLPGFTRISMFPRMCAAAGVPIQELISRLIELALEREAVQADLRYER